MDVLVVDDDGPSRELMDLVLAAAGHTCRSCARIEEAWTALDTGRLPDVVVTDLVVGGSRDAGLELIAGLRADERFRDIPVVAVTGVTQARDLARARDAGADVCLPKPLDVSGLIRTLEGLRAVR